MKSSSIFLSLSLLLTAVASSSAAPFSQPNYGDSLLKRHQKSTGNHKNGHKNDHKNHQNQGWNLGTAQQLVSPIFKRDDGNHNGDGSVWNTGVAEPIRNPPNNRSHSRRDEVPANTSGP
ncbi:16742_t:CDS:1, partial [Racocetra fulgida]